MQVVWKIVPVSFSEYDLRCFRNIWIIHKPLRNIFERFANESVIVIQIATWRISHSLFAQTSTFSKKKKRFTQNWRQSENTRQGKFVETIIIYLTYHDIDHYFERVNNFIIDILLNNQSLENVRLYMGKWDHYIYTWRTRSIIFRRTRERTMIHIFREIHR